MNAITAIIETERHYPGGDLTAHPALISQHVANVATWLSSVGMAAAKSHASMAPPLGAAALRAAVRLVDAGRVRAALAPILVRDGAGTLLLPAGQILVDTGYPLFTIEGLRRQQAHLRGIGLLNPIVALRWMLTDLLLRLNAPNAEIALSVADYAGAVVPAPYAHGFAIGSGALYSRAYHFAQPSVNVGFDCVALKVLAAMVSESASLSYAADVTGVGSFAPYINPLRALLGANAITAAAWLALYQASALEKAVPALTSASHRRFGQDPDSSHIGMNVASTAYGYGMMKSISLNASAAFRRALQDFTLPRERSISMVSVL